ncbi:MAG: DUF4350 domain-containing protein [Gemmatimonadales bacterium]
MSYRLEIGLAVLLALGIALAAWAGTKKKGETSDFDFRSSTFVSGPYGSKALHDVLQRLGRLSERRRTSLENLATQRAYRPAILVFLSPLFPLEDNEIEQVVRYVRSGGAVLATGSGGGFTRCAGWRVQVALSRGDSMPVVSADPALRLPRTSRVLTPRETDNEESPRLEALRKGEPEDEQLGICNTLVAYAADTIVAAVNNRPVILRLRYRGGGTVTLAADASWFTNRAWRESDIPVVALPLLTPRLERPGRVVWDEYHQGFGDGGGQTWERRTWSWVRSSPLGWVILQLIAVALVWLAMTAVRFGPARSVIERRRRSPLEHLEALGAGLESAGDADTAVQRLALGLRRRLNRAGQLGKDEVGAWLEGLELAMRGPQGREAVRRLHYLLTVRGRAGDAPARRVLQAAQAVEDVWEELRPRRTRNGS